MNTTIRIKLSIMMFLEFFIWGAWFVTLGTFLASNLNASGSETASVFSTQSWGAIIAPFIIGMIAKLHDFIYANIGFGKLSFF